MNFFKTVTFFTILLVFLVGCGGNSDSEPSASTPLTPVTPSELTKEIPLVILSDTTTELTSNQQTVIIDVKVVESGNASPYTNGDVKILYPKAEVLAGRDIGSFESSSVKVENGTTRFTYSGPSQLSDNTSTIVFYFYHESNPSDLKQYTFTINPAPNQIVLEGYKLTSNISTSNAVIGLETGKKLSFFIEEDNEAKTLVADTKIDYLRVTTLNPALALLSSTSEETNSTSVLLSSNKNSFSIIAKSYKISGIVPLKVEASFTDVNGKTQLLSKVYNLLIISGPPSAMSITYDGTVESSYSGFTEHWTLRVTDKYNNLVNTNPAVSMGLIVGFAKDASGNNLYVDANNAASGTIAKTDNTFTSPISVFDAYNVDVDTDTLVVFGDYDAYDASGKWDFTKESDTVLNLIDKYDGNDTAGLGFAVGRNYRQTRDGESVANIYPADNNYTLGSMGVMNLEISGDAYLIGKNVMIWVNLLGYDLHTKVTTRTGEVTKETIRNFGLESSPVSVSRGTTGEVKRIYIYATKTGERYKDARFLYDVKVSDNLKINDYNVTHRYGDSNSLLGTDTQFSAFVDINVTDVDGNSTGTIELKNLKIVSEF